MLDRSPPQRLAPDTPAPPTAQLLRCVLAMEANNNSKHGKAYSVAEEDATTTNNMMMKQKHLSDDEAAAGEPEENYRGWKAMPYVIGQCLIICS